MGKHVDEISKNARGGSELQQEYLWKYVDNNLLDKFQIVITRIRELDPNKMRLFWTKETATEPEGARIGNPEILNQFEYVIHNSDYQRDMYRLHLGIPYDKQHVLKNGIEPADVKIDSKFENGKVKLIYSSTPQRGLNILYAVFDELYKEDQNIELNIYSSFDVYGHYKRNEPFLPLFEQCKQHPGINYYGSVSHEELLERTKEQHILAYPSIWEESSCITALENASAGNLIVTNNLGALTETTAGFAQSYDYTIDVQEHARRFYVELKKAIQSVRTNQFDSPYGTTLTNHLEEQKKYIDTMYNWTLRGKQWTKFLTSIS